MIGKKTGGRKKGVPNKVNADLKAIAQRYTAEAIETLATIMRTSEGDAPRVGAIKEILDRGHGKSPQAITGAEGGPLIVEIVRYAED